MIDIIEKAKAIELNIPDFPGVKDWVSKYGGTKNSGPADGLEGVVTMITDLTNLALNFAGIFAFIMFLYAAFTLTFSNGVDANIEKGKKTLLWSVLGLVIIATAKLVLELVKNTLNQ